MESNCKETLEECAALIILAELGAEKPPEVSNDTWRSVCEHVWKDAENRLSVEVTRNLESKQRLLDAIESAHLKMRQYLAAKALLMILAVILLAGCEAVAEIVTAPLFISEGVKESYDRKQTEKQEGHPYGLTSRSYYDARNPQPKAFYDWMDKVGRIAARMDDNIDGDEDYFITYWRKGYTPEQAMRHWVNDPWPNMGGGS